jgi:uncharacterized membrane protein YjfL (UPF0719 family)
MLAWKILIREAMRFEALLGFKTWSTGSLIKAYNIAAARKLGGGLANTLLVFQYSLSDHTVYARGKWSSVGRAISPRR